MENQDIDLHILIEREDDLYSALCLELDIASQGTTIEEARKNIREAIELYLEEVLEAGEEKEFIPRPAPVEEWLKYFEVEAQKLKSRLEERQKENLRYHELVYAS
ncbi:MAG TPA: type II toxin-antitoxin system HicB family antitoxin [bacterium]